MNKEDTVNKTSSQSEWTGWMELVAGEYMNEEMSEKETDGEEREKGRKKASEKSIKRE